jgi:hypothetical protein
MALSDSIIKRMDAALRRVGPMRRDVYKRVITRTGGNDLIGRAASITTADTKLNPQPFYMDNGGSEMLVSTGGDVQATDYTFVMSPTAMTLAEVQNKNTFLLLKDSAGNIEMLRITSYEPTDFQGAVVEISITATSVSR